MKLYVSLLLLLSSFTFILNADERYPGGNATHKQPSNHLSYTWPSPAISFEKRLDYQIGKAIFDKIWVFAPSSTTASDGLGPLYNARSCVRCHKGNGRGVIESNQSTSPSLFLRLSISPSTEEHRATLNLGKVGFIPEPTYGKQLQTFAYPGGHSEGVMEVHYRPIEMVINKSQPQIVEILEPIYTIKNLGYGPLHPDVLFSPRIAPPLIGLGLLEAIDENQITVLADPNDDNNDGISGKVNKVWDEITHKSVLGRFGWKAGTGSLAQQNAAALSGDIGISSTLFPQNEGECTSKQLACFQQVHGNTMHGKTDQKFLEAPKTMTDLLLFYIQNIAVPPARITSNSEREKGKQLFNQAGCHKCHQPSYVIAPTLINNNKVGQTIWPYTDLLLHDMGQGLADNRPEFLANGQEWRTPPLWGIGLTKQVSGKTFYLHDGRARNLIEAILWHGGEAEKSKQTFVNMSTKQRDQLILFLESL